MCVYVHVCICMYALGSGHVGSIKGLVLEDFSFLLLEFKLEGPLFDSLSVLG